jgi:S-adenosylmethionine synthetase
MSRVACEVLCKGGDVVLAGEVTSDATLDLDAIVREVVRQIGYTGTEDPFDADRLRVTSLLTPQAREIGSAVHREADPADALGAGDQGIMVGYATAETPELMPLPLVLAHGLSRALAEARKAGEVDWLRPDGKTQVSVEYEDDRPVRVTRVIVSTQHAPGLDQAAIAAFVRDSLVPRVLGDWHDERIEMTVNPSGSFEQGGPSADSGLTGRKIIMDTYGPFARHGGGSFSGKDATKVDRSGAYFARHVARRLVRGSLAKRAEVQVAYAIGLREPVAVSVDTLGTGDAKAAAELLQRFDFRPAAIIERLGLRRPIYRLTTDYGHFGRPGLPWEEDD